MTELTISSDEIRSAIESYVSDYSPEVTREEVGIVAECGGSAMCGTCHVYVDPAWLDKLPAPLPNELEMLECTAAERLPESRLSCQIKLTPGLDGLVVRIPDRQL
jgi:ferredoxin